MIEITKDTIVIKKERYEELIDNEILLSCLQGCGVDNWEGYDDAINMYQEEIKS